MKSRLMFIKDSMGTRLSLLNEIDDIFMLSPKQLERLANCCNHARYCDGDFVEVFEEVVHD